MTTPFFTIITATYNAEKTLSQLLDSLASQTCKDFELVVQDGASNDNTASIVEQYRGKVPHISFASENDTGIYDAWNKALKRIQGEWVLFLGADDSLYLDKTLENVKKTIEKNLTATRSIDFWAGEVVQVCNEGNPILFIKGKVEGAREHLHSQGTSTPFPGLFINASVLNLHKFNPFWRIAGDYDFLCRAWLFDDSAKLLPFIVTKMRIGGVSTNYAHAAAVYKEVNKIKKLHFDSNFTMQDRFALIRTQLVSWLYTYAPNYAGRLHHFARFMQGKKTSLVNQGRVFCLENVPIFIISFNRLSYLEQIVDWFEQAGFHRITIVDNNSTYPPLLQYLANSPHQVVSLKENLGHLAVWQCGLFSEILSNDYYIVTDPDVQPVADCPNNLISIFFNCLQLYPNITKCGVSLKIDDIPEYFPLKQTVLEMEEKFWEKKTPNGEGYFAHIDTTLALYRPDIYPDEEKWFEAVRLAPPFTARHLPWYENPAEPTEESLYYQTQTKAKSSFWSVHNLQALKAENIRLRERITELELEVTFLSKSTLNKLSLVTFKSLKHIKRRLFR